MYFVNVHLSSTKPICQSINLSSNDDIEHIYKNFNNDLLKNDSHTITAEFLNAMISNTFHPLIRTPTRITHNTASLTDNILTSVIDKTSSFKKKLIQEHNYVYVNVDVFVSSIVLYTISSLFSRRNTLCQKAWLRFTFLHCA